MNSFIRQIKHICFTGSKLCNLGGRDHPSDVIINGVVNNSVLVSHNGMIVVHNGS